MHKNRFENRFLIFYLCRLHIRFDLLRCELSEKNRYFVGNSIFMRLYMMGLLFVGLSLASCAGSDAKKDSDIILKTPLDDSTIPKQDSVSETEQLQINEPKAETKVDEKRQEVLVPVDRRGKWGKSDRFAFLENCVSNAKLKMGDEKAKEYCSCVLELVEAKYASAENAANMDLKDMFEMAKTCMQNN